MSKVPAMVWRQGGNDDHIRWSERSAYTGSAFLWPPAQLLDDRRTGNVPAIAGVGDTTCMAWRGGGPDERIWWSRLSGGSLSVGGAEWSTQAQSGFATLTFPTLVTYNGRMFMFFKATDNYDYAIRWSELRGDRWVHPITGGDNPAAATYAVEIMTDAGVSAAENIHDGQLYLAWRGRGTDARIHWAFFDGDQWAWQPAMTDRETSSVPSIACDGTNVYMVSRRVADDFIEWSVLQGSRWSPPRMLADRRTSGRPTIGVSAQGDLVMTWVGADTDTRVWWSRFADSQWGPAQACTDRWLNPGLVGGRDIDLSAILA
jgi:hypothetical protein